MALYQRLANNPDFQYFKQTAKKSFGNHVRITDSNAKEAFIYEAIRAQTAEEILNFDQAMINALKITLKTKS